MGGASISASPLLIGGQSSPVATGSASVSAALSQWTHPPSGFQGHSGNKTLHWILTYVEFLRALGSQSGVSVWQHTLVG